MKSLEQLKKEQDIDLIVSRLRPAYIEQDKDELYQTKLSKAILSGEICSADIIDSEAMILDCVNELEEWHECDKTKAAAYDLLVYNLIHRANKVFYSMQSHELKDAYNKHTYKTILELGLQDE
jgi:hemoglobin-like flavoprotein